MKWSLREVGRSSRAAVVVLWVAALLYAGSANASTLWDDGLVRLSDLQAGAEFDSENGFFHFSNFDFSAIGFDESALFDYLAAPRADGFKLLLGLGSPFGPDTTLEMTYTVSSNGAFGIGGAEISNILLLQDAGDQLAEILWQGSNGATMSAIQSEAIPFDGVATSFTPVTSLMVQQSARLSGAMGVLKFETGYFEEPMPVPETGTGLLFAAGFGAWIAVQRRRPHYQSR